MTRGLLASRLPEDAVVTALEPHSAGGHVAVVALRNDRDFHEEALNELLLAAEEVGYAFAEAEVTQVADRAVEMAVGLGLAGLGVGSKSENAELAGLGAFAGWVVGLFVGANMKKAEVLYRVQLTPQGWHFMAAKPQPAVPVRSAA